MFENRAEAVTIAGSDRLRRVDHQGSLSLGARQTLQSRSPWHIARTSVPRDSWPAPNPAASTADVADTLRGEIGEHRVQDRGVGRHLAGREFLLAINADRSYRHAVLFEPSGFGLARHHQAGCFEILDHVDIDHAVQLDCTQPDAPLAPIRQGIRAVPTIGEDRARRGR